MSDQALAIMQDQEDASDRALDEHYALVPKPDESEQQTMVRMREQYKAALRIMSSFKEGVHYYNIKGKHSLGKKGAEFIFATYGCRAVPVLDHQVRDYENRFYAFEYRCDVVHIHSGLVLGHGIGASSSHEVQSKPLNSANTVKKMAWKSAKIDAALHIAMLSGDFTQDLENLRAETQAQEAGEPSAKPPASDGDLDVAFVG